MKKIVSVALSAAMVATMATSFAFAADPKTDLAVSTEVFYIYNSDSHKLSTIDSTNPDFYTGRDLYILIGDKDDLSTSDLKNFKFKSHFESGKNMIEDIKFTIVKNGDSRQAALKLSIKDNYSVEETFIDGVITLYSRNGYTFTGDVDEIEIPVVGYMSYRTNYIASDDSLNPNYPLVTFADNCGEVEISFTDDIYFEVNADNQRDLFLRYNDDVNEEIFAKYPNADLMFVGFDGDNKTFNKTGVLYIPFEIETEAAYAYRINGDQLIEVKNAYNYEDECFAIKTKTLYNYILSDTPLKEIAPIKPIKPNKPNPDTGR